jgi:hypothetical protein
VAVASLPLLIEFEWRKRTKNSSTNKGTTRHDDDGDDDDAMRMTVNRAERGLT